MFNHRNTVRAVYRKGVLELREPLDLAEGAEVNVTVDPEGLLKRLYDLLRDVHENNKDIPLKQIEEDVDRIIREVRAERG